MSSKVSIANTLHIISYFCPLIIIGYFIDEEYDGGISQLNIVTEFYDEIASGKRCFHSDVADILSWHEFGGANMSGAFITAPSDCDGMI